MTEFYHFNLNKDLLQFKTCLYVGDDTSLNEISHLTLCIFYDKVLNAWIRITGQIMSDQ